jgi:two-component system, OmpR family, alkaline phosphatase synthesis response regulator PhoP
VGFYNNDRRDSFIEENNMALIYIVEDDKNIREIESFAMKNSGYQTVDFENAKDFYKELSVKIPNLILLDVMLPDEDGLSIVKKIREMNEARAIPIIMVTAKTTEIDKVKGLDIGADDYITKPFGVMELISRVKALLRRIDVAEDDKILSAEDILMDHEKHCVYVKDVACELTFKEYELLRILLLNKGIVTSREIIMDRVWGTDFEGESRTLDMHIKTLRQKLKESGSVIKTVRNVGYIIE